MGFAEETGTLDDSERTSVVLQDSKYEKVEARIDYLLSSEHGMSNVARTEVDGGVILDPNGEDPIKILEHDENTVIISYFGDEPDPNSIWYDQAC